MGMRLIDLLRDFHLLRIELPLMQRDYCWQHGRVQQLLDSLFRGLPIGCFYIWKSDQAQETRGPRRGGSDGGIHRYLLDGQQRLVSLQRALSPDETVLAGRAYFDLDRNRFRVLRANDNRTRQLRWVNDPACIPLSTLIDRKPTGRGSFANIDSALSPLKGLHVASKLKEFGNQLSRIATMLDCDAEYREYETNDRNTAVELFQRLNSGKNLSKANKIEAGLAADDMGDVLKSMRDFLKLPSVEAYGWGTDFLTRLLVTFHWNDATLFKESDRAARDWRGRAAVGASWKKAEAALLRVMDILDTIGWCDLRWLPSANMLIPVAYALRDTRRAFHEGDVDAVRSFLCATAATGMTQNSVETKINSFIKPFTPKNKASEPGGRSASTEELWKLWKAIPTERRRPLTPRQITEACSRSSPLMKVYLAFLVANGAKSWPDNKPVAAIARGKSVGSLDVHHVFPQQLRVDEPKLWSDRELNTMANYAIIGDGGNRELGDRPPGPVYRGMSEQQRQDAKLQCIDTYMAPDLMAGKYEEFCETRAKLLANRLSEFMHFGERG